MATQLEIIAEKERQSLLTRNSYLEKNGYGVTHHNALSDGDEKGKGTGSFLDTTNGGSSIDNIERINEIKINEYQKDKPYTTPTV